MDRADEANDYSEVFLNAAITNARNYTRAISPKGYCHFCEGDIERPKLFCDADCAKDYDRLQYNKR